jgi:peptide deformylase
MSNTINLDKFVPPHDPILTRRAEIVPHSQVSSKEITDCIDQMLHVAYGEQADASKPLLVGLAAPQIGITQRIILVDVAADGKGKIGDLRVYINPHISQASADQTEWYEGCFSTSRVCGIVSRHTSVVIRALDVKGNYIEEKFDGYTARIFQHEIDHLDGRFFADHIYNPDHLHWVEKNQFPEYRDKGGWRNWPCKCSREKWDLIKTGKE